MSALLWNSLLLAQQATKGWTSLFLDLEPDKRFALLIVAIACGTGVICTIVVFVSSTIDTMHRRRLEADMKRDMIERGMSADEIAKIMVATPPQSVAERWVDKNQSR